MTLTIRVLGVEVFHVELADAETDPGDYSSTAVGFTAQLDVPDTLGLPPRGWEDKH